MKLASFCALSLLGEGGNCGSGLRYWYWRGNRTSNIPPQFVTLEKNHHILRPYMIANRTIQDNSHDMTYNFSLVQMTHEEIDQKEGFRDLK